MFFQHNQLPGPYTGVLSVIYLYLSLVEPCLLEIGCYICNWTDDQRLVTDAGWHLSLLFMYDSRSQQCDQPMNAYPIFDYCSINILSFGPCVRQNSPLICRHSTFRVDLCLQWHSLAIKSISSASVYKMEEISSWKIIQTVNI